MGRLFMVAAMVVSVGISTFADLAYYTFDGVVTYSNSANLVSNFSPAHYVVGIDFDRPGAFNSEGSVYTMEDFDNDPVFGKMDLFYAEIISSSLFENTYTGSDGWNHGAYGENIDPLLADKTWLNVGSENHILQLFKSGSFESIETTWQTGQTFESYESFNGAANHSLYAFAKVTLTDIRQTAVPEPGTMSLFGVGLLGLGGLGLIRRRN